MIPYDSSHCYSEAVINENYPKDKSASKYGILLF